MGVRSGSGPRKRHHLRIKCAHKRPGHIDRNSAASVIATNIKEGEPADGTGTRIDTCLINRWRVRINRERLYNVKAYAPKKRGQEPEPPRPYRGERLLERTWFNSVWTPRLTTVRWPRPSLSNPRSTNYIVWVFLRANLISFWVVTNRVITLPLTH